MTATPLQTELLSETYHDVRKLLYWIVHDFVRSYGGDFDELLCSAHYHFMRAYRDHNERRGRFSSWLPFTIRKDLLEERRVAARKQRLAKLEHDVELDELHHPGSSFSLFEFIDELGEDARMVLELTFNTPSELVELMVSRGGRGVNRRRVLKDYLTGIGWTASRIAESFSEIATALTHF